ncbi:MAG: VWA domain-containing protein [Phycisphaerales bacterium]|nr:VWA domain-containing protein [Phycisphaerales bacterium]
MTVFQWRVVGLVGLVLGYLSSAAAASREVVFALDLSGSISESEMQLEINGIKNTVSEIIPRDGSVRVGVVVYSDRARVLLPLTPVTTSSIATIIHPALDSVATHEYRWGATNLADALFKSRTLLGGPGSVTTADYIILVGDGEDNRTSPEAVFNECEASLNAGVRVCAIAVGATPAGAEQLRMIAEHTGGEYGEAAEFSQFDPICADCLGIIATPRGRMDTSRKGSLLVYSNVEVRWDAGGNVIQDTFLEMSNDYPDSVAVQLYFVNGDLPSAIEPGWNILDNVIHLTQDESTYWSAATGLPKGVSPWSALDPGPPPGRPDADVPGARVLRGAVYAWAVDRFNGQIRWNHLSGKAMIVNYADASAAEYPVWAAQAMGVEHGLRVGQGGVLRLNGLDYEQAPDQLILDFVASGSMALSGGGALVGVDTDLTLHPVSVDFRQETTGPVLTKARFDIWNENEVRFSNTEVCVSCWHQQLLSAYASIPNHFLLGNLQTNKGKARIDGIASIAVCGPQSVNAALIGVSVRELGFEGGQRRGLTGGALVGAGDEAAQILYDVLTGPSEVRERASTLDGESIFESIR